MKKAERKRAEDLKKEHKVASALAGKALPALQPVGDRLGKLFDFLSNKSDQLPEITVKQMEESKALLTQLKTNFQAVMRKVSQNQSVCFDDVRAGFPSQAQVPGINSRVLEWGSCSILDLRPTASHCRPSEGLVSGVAFSILS